MDAHPFNGDKGEGVSPLDISGLMTLGTLEKVAKVGTGALSGVRVAGTLVNRHVLDHYRTALGDIHRDGFYRTLIHIESTLRERALAQLHAGNGRP